MAWDLLDEDMEDITDWTDEDLGDGVSQENPAGQMECSAPSTAGSQGRRIRDIGSMPTVFTIEMRANHDLLGTTGNGDTAFLNVERAGLQVQIRFGTDGLFINDGASYNEVGTNIVDTATWNIWKFIVNAAAGDASATCKVYKNSIYQGTADCSKTGTYTDGKITLTTVFQTTATLKHIDYIKIGTGAIVECLFQSILF